MVTERTTKYRGEVYIKKCPTKVSTFVGLGVSFFGSADDQLVAELFDELAVVFLVLSGRQAEVFERRRSHLATSFAPTELVVGVSATFCWGFLDVPDFSGHQDDQALDPAHVFTPFLGRLATPVAVHDPESFLI